MTLNDLVNIGLKIAREPDKLIGTPGGRQVFEAAVVIAQQEFIYSKRQGIAFIDKGDKEDKGDKGEGKIPLQKL